MSVESRDIDCGLTVTIRDGVVSWSGDVPWNAEQVADALIERSEILHQKAADFDAFMSRATNARWPEGKR